MRPLNSWKVQCRNASCQKIYIVGEVFYETVPGFKLPPEDHIMPPEISTQAWHSGQQVNKLSRLVRCDASKVELVDPGSAR